MIISMKRCTLLFFALFCISCSTSRAVSTPVHEKNPQRFLGRWDISWINFPHENRQALLEVIRELAKKDATYRENQEAIITDLSASFQKQMYYSVTFAGDGKGVWSAERDSNSMLFSWNYDYDQQLVTLALDEPQISFVLREDGEGLLFEHSFGVYGRQKIRFVKSKPGSAARSKSN